MGTLDVEEKARAKDTYGKGVESSSANAVQKKKQYAFCNKKEQAREQVSDKSEAKANYNF